MKARIICLGLIITGFTLQAQSLATQSIASTGWISTGEDTPHIHWNVGEVIIGKTAGQNKLNQGFYQQLDLSTFTKNHNKKPGMFKAFPNPSSGQIQVRANETLYLSVVSINGEVLDTKDVQGSPLLMDLRHLASGTYYLIGQNSNRDLQMVEIILIKN